MPSFKFKISAQNWPSRMEGRDDRKDKYFWIGAGYWFHNTFFRLYVAESVLPSWSLADFTFLQYWELVHHPIFLVFLRMGQNLKEKHSKRKFHHLDFGSVPPLFTWTNTVSLSSNLSRRRCRKMIVHGDKNMKGLWRMRCCWWWWGVWRKGAARGASANWTRSKIINRLSAEH
jgi:hypothetical protein